MAVFTVTDDIVEAVRATVSNQFPAAQIDAVSVKAGEDSDGDPVLNIYVVFNGSKERETLNEEKMAGLARHIISSLVDRDFFSFPLVSFVSKKDAAKLNLEIA